MRVRRRGFAVVVALLSFLLLFAFAASNTVPNSRAGDGEGQVTGYTVSNISYVLDTNNPSDLIGVKFTLDAQATSVYAGVWDGTGWVWSNLCSFDATTNEWSCTLRATVPVQAVTKLRVVAAE